MAEEFHIKITESSDGGGSSPSNPLQEEKLADARERRARRAAAEARAVRAEERAEERRERARRKEEERLKDRAAKSEKQRQAELEKDARQREREERRRAKEAMQREREFESLHKQGASQRRRFINDMFGTFNRVHTGRVINHAIDFAQSIFNSRPLKSTVVDGIAGVGSQATQTANASGGSRLLQMSNLALLGKTIADSLKNAMSSIFGKIRSIFTGSSSNVVNATAVTPRGITQGVTQGTTSGAVQGLIPHPRLYTQEPQDASGDEKPSSGRFSKTKKLALQGIIQGGRATAKAAASHPIVAAIVGVTAIIVAGLVATGIAITATFAITNRAMKKFAATLDGIPGELNIAQIESELKMFAHNLNRSQEFGSGLANIERDRSRGELARRDMGDAIIRGIMPFVQEGNETLANLQEALVPFAVSFGMTLERVLERGTEILETINSWSDSYDKSVEEGAAKIDAIFPGLRKAIQKYLKVPTDSPDNELLKELHAFLNTDEENEKNKDATFEVNVKI